MLYGLLCLHTVTVHKDKATGEPDLTKAPVFRVKIPVWEGVWKVEIYHEDDNKLFPNPGNPIISPIEFLQKGTMQPGNSYAVWWNLVCEWEIRINLEAYIVQAASQKPKVRSLTGS